MPELLANGGTVALWAGWRLELPPCHHGRNPDGSWSAWGDDWAVDVHIIEATNAPAEAFMRPETPRNCEGDGWIGSTRILSDIDAGQHVYRLAGTLAAAGSCMSCWVSYRHGKLAGMANAIIAGASHSTDAEMANERKAKKPWQFWK